MKQKKKSSLIYIVIILAIIALSLTVYYFLKTQYLGSNYIRALESENSADKCVTPSGYTDESWRAHMSHHPDRYGECLE